jgi:hypothetical protein
MVNSINGRLLVDRWTPPAAVVANDIVHRIYEQMSARFGANGWIVGRKAMQAYAEDAARTVAWEAHAP